MSVVTSWLNINRNKNTSGGTFIYKKKLGEGGGVGFGKNRNEDRADMSKMLRTARLKTTSADR